ncbi:AAA family ATPase [Mycolicibacterium psychrotolerans]|uniref:Nuclease SbcCD subunit C n=1 Tax=Mycolicibacterium psychrotolerans TaxID=216929 RepID=A0A7I7M346_9MYCO|nr:AAA family ATPase [Mycolicibacterium psychrotolerans]BBX66584.1 hypothetical protein MPSYJ_00450 [Mycolicibacterium psychrotolerans]
MESSEEASSVSGPEVERSVRDVILDMLDADTGLDESVKDSVLDALAQVTDEAASTDTKQSGPTFLTGISVMGFRGIGPQAKVDLHPAPGLTVISGRNGSGKSSFVEALELALTGTSYRWLNKQVLWADAWQNLHHMKQRAIRIGFAVQGRGAVTVGIDWDPEADLTDRRVWTQFASDKYVDGTDVLGWARALEVWRPLLSYDELGRLFDGGPSALYDALAKLLGLEVFADTEKWLATELKTTKAIRGQADDERKRLLALLTDRDDERAARAAALLRRKGGDLDDVLALATGSDEAGQTVVGPLRALTHLQLPSPEDMDAAATRLRGAVQKLADAATNVADSTSLRVDLLTAALRFHEHVTTEDTCPVCGEGTLDTAWAARARSAIKDAEATLAEYRRATAELGGARTAARALLSRIAKIEPIPGIDLVELDAYNEAVTAALVVPDNDVELADHVESGLLAVADVGESLRVKAAEALQQRENEWAPLAAQLGAWVPIERQARALDAAVKALTLAKNWVTKHAAEFRNLRLEPVAAQARKIWGQLRQESNVDLGEITLEGVANRRKATLSGSVDGQPTAALSVMSQGEKHALALALFLPRAAASASPFRFVVLDDPIQAMDPAKIDGFVDVLKGIADTHQVVVFSHDDRLASVIRETGVDARLVEVVRETQSRVTVRDNLNPALRQVSDIFALISDERLPDDIRARVLPGMFRTALESASKQTYFSRQALAGRPRSEFEDSWQSTKKTSPKLALAVRGDATADLKSWLNEKPERYRTLRLANAVHHQAQGITKDEVRELERTVKTILALR